MKKYFSIISILLIVASFSACSVVDAEKLPNISTTTVTEATEQTSSGYETTTMPESTTKLIATTVVTTVKEVSTTGKSVTSTSAKAIESTRAKTTKAETTTTKAVKKLPNYYPKEKALELFEMVNDYREANGSRRLVLDETLCKLAYVRAEEQIELEGHTRPDGTSFETVCDEYGYEWNNISENIVIGPPNPEGMIDGWKSSPGHNENMLKAKWGKSGIAFYVDAEGTCYVVQLFEC